MVNIITKRRFEGLEVEAQSGGFDNGFGAKSSLAVTGGQNFLDDRLNLTVSGFWRKEDGIDATDIPSAHNYGLIQNPADLSSNFGFRFGGVTIPNDGIPNRLFVQNVGSELTTRNGVLINALTGGAISFDAQGHVVATPQRSGYSSFGYGQLPANCDACYFPDQGKQISSPIETRGGQVKVGYDFDSHLHGYVDLKFVQNDVQNAAQPSFIAGDYGLQADNAYLTPEIRAALGGVPAQDFVFSQFLNDARTQDIRRRTYRVVAGLDGDFDARFAQVKWNGALNYGETDVLFHSSGVRILDNFAAAIDSVIDPATGKAACRINVPSAAQTGQGAGALNPSACVPWDPFGRQNSAAALAYSFGTFDTSDTLTQQVANLNASFDTGRFFTLPGGPVGVAVGAEYRMERSASRSDPMLTEGLTEFTATNSSGGYNVSEGYVELNAPVFRHAGPGLDELSFDLAYRGAHYSTVGGVGAYKVGGVYGPASWLKLRATYSRAIRAPDITEAFMPTSGSFFVVKDPCSVENISSNVNYAKNCAAAGLPPGFTAVASSISVPGTESGNPNLNPERSFSYTAGVVLLPPMARNLSITFDYYAIKIKDAITEVAAQDVLNNCYGGATLDPTYCSLFTREPTHNGVNFIQTTFVNAAKLYTDGFELQVNYAADVAPLTERWRYVRGLDGRLGFNLTADYVRHLRNYPFQSDPSQVNVLEGTATTSFGDNPQLKGVAQLNYSQGPLSVAWTTRYVGKMALFSRDPTAADHSESLNVPFTEPTFYHDLLVSYRLGGDREGTELFIGANNIFDEEPPFTVVGQGRDASFDLGRFLFVGARYRR